MFSDNDADLLIKRSWLPADFSEMVLSNEAQQVTAARNECLSNPLKSDCKSLVDTCMYKLVKGEGYD